MGPFLIIFAVAMIGLMSGVSGGSYAAFVIFVGIALSAISGLAANKKTISWEFIASVKISRSLMSELIKDIFFNRELSKKSSEPEERLS